MRVPTLKRLKQSDRTTEMLQSSTGLTIDVLQRLQILDGHLLRNVAIGTTNTDVEHKLNRRLRGWFQVRGQKGATSSTGSSASATTVHGTIWRWNETDVSEFTSVVGTGASLAAGTFTYGGTSTTAPKIPCINVSFPASAGAANYLWTVNSLSMPEDFQMRCIAEGDSAFANAYVGFCLMYQDATHWCTWTRYPGAATARFHRYNGTAIQGMSATPSMPNIQIGGSTAHLGPLSCTMITKFPTASADPGMISHVGLDGGAWSATNGLAVDSATGITTGWHAGWRQATTSWQVGIALIVLGATAAGTCKIGKLAAVANASSTTTQTTTAINTASGGLGLREETSPDDTKFLRLVAGEAATVDLWVF